MYESEIRYFVENGWFRAKLIDHGCLSELRQSLLMEIRKTKPEVASLEKYHEYIIDDDQHIALQDSLRDWFVAGGWVARLIRQNVEIFWHLIGQDLHLQAQPYLRIVRPNKSQDNVGIHRDTHYGGSPYELSVHIPFTDTGRDGTMGAISGSHVKSDAFYPYTKTESTMTKQGSVRHKLGFTYAPKVMSDDVQDQVEPAGTRLGEAMIFSLSLVHGQIVNRSGVTRFSTDVRLVNSMAPIDWRKNEETGYYKALSSSPVSAAAAQYYAACRAESNER